MSRSFRLRGDDNFIVMATDGLWEVINPKACIAIINQLINQYSLEVGNHEFLLNSRRFVMFIGIKMSDDIPTKEDFIRNSIDLDRSKGWELISASTIMKNEFKYSGAKFEIVQSYLHAIDILSNPSYNGSYTPIQNKLPLLLQIKGRKNI